MSDDNYFELGIESGGVPVRCNCHAAGLTDAAHFDGDLHSPTFGVTMLRMAATHDVAVVAQLEEHPYRPELSRVQMILWGPPGCTHGMHMKPEQARRLAAQLIEAADEVDGLRNA